VSNSKKFTKEQVISALVETKGMVHNAADLLGCHHQTVYNYRDKYPEIKQAIEHERGKFLDLAETKLFDAVQRGEAWAIPFTLKTIGKERGYVEKQDINLSFDKMSTEELIKFITNQQQETKE
jgi:hypothetical protein